MYCLQDCVVNVLKVTSGDEMDREGVDAQEWGAHRILGLGRLW